MNIKQPSLTSNGGLRSRCAFLVAGLLFTLGAPGANAQSEGDQIHAGSSCYAYFGVDVDDFDHIANYLYRKLGTGGGLKYIYCPVVTDADSFPTATSPDYLLVEVQYQYQKPANTDLTCKLYQYDDEGDLVDSKSQSESSSSTSGTVLITDTLHSDTWYLTFFCQVPEGFRMGWYQYYAVVEEVGPG